MTRPAAESVVVQQASSAGASSPRRQTPPPTSLVFCFLTALACLATLAGGMLHLLLLDEPAPGEFDQEDVVNGASLLLICGSLTLLSGAWLAWRKPRWTLFATTLFGMIAAVTLILAETAARFFVPPWPASALHGVLPGEDRQPWGLLGPAADQVGFNAWGQRDRERTLSPAPQAHRVVFIGDSFLDDTVFDPVSLVVERMIDRADVEVVNLGVSATGPDEYYHRLARVGVPLGANSCVMFLYLGNDLAAGPRTLQGTLGIAAVSPRGSLLSDLQLRGLNHLLTNRQRPMLQAWGAGRELAASELALHARFQNASDAEAAEILLSLENFPPPVAARLRRQLSQPEMAPFFAMLRRPDHDLFRSYFLVDSLWLAALDQAPRTIDDIDSARHWIRLSHRLCQQRGINFLLVVIPQGFAVDRRLQEMWFPLADIARLTDGTERAGRMLTQQLRSDGVDVLDLHAALGEAPGSYLNLDGHWSKAGIQCAAESVRTRINAWFKERSD